MVWLSAGDEENGVQPEGVARFLGRHEVPIVNRIEGAAQNAQSALPLATCC